MEKLSVSPAFSHKPFISCIILCIMAFYFAGCSTQAPYMRGWDLEPRRTHRWTDGEFKIDKLSEDEKVAYTEFGTPDTIRFFRTLDTRQRVYEWLYLESNRIVWFVDGRRVDYVAVDSKLSALKKETRERGTDKLTKGGILGGIVGGLAAGALLYGDNLGLKD